MKRGAVFFVLAAVMLLASTVVAQDEDKISIDEFNGVQGPFLVITTSEVTGGSFDDSFIDSADNILGTERDVFYEISDATQSGLVFACGVSGGVFSESAPPTSLTGVLGSVLLQWDGTDGTAASLDTSGLGLVDLTLNLADEFYAIGTTDFDFTTEIRVYSGGSSANYCRADFTIPGGTNSTISTPYSSFTNVGSGCSFTSVGAVEISFDIDAALDLTLNFLRTRGPIPSTPSPTASPSPSNTRSPSVTRSPSPSRSISPSPSPIVEDDECVCVCPAFRCELFRSDDEDGGIVGYRSISDPYWNWYGFPTSLLYGFYTWSYAVVA